MLPVTRALLLKGVYISVILTLIGYFFDYSVNVSLARLLRVEDYGDFSIAISWAMFWMTVSTLGSFGAVTKLLPIYMEQKDFQRGLGLVRFYMLLSIFIGLVIALITLGISFFSLRIGHKAGSLEFHPIVLALFMLPFMAASATIYSLTLAVNKYLLASFSKNIVMSAILLALIWINYALGFAMNDWRAVELMLVSYIILNVIQLTSIKKLFSQIVRTKDLKFEPNKWLKLSVPIMLANLVFFASRQMNLNLLEYLGPNESSVGHFAAAMKISEIIFVISSSINSVIAPVLGILLQISHKVRQRLYILHLMFMTVPLLTLTIIIVIFGKYILGLFGESYVYAYSSLVMLTIGTFLNVNFSNAFYYLQYSGFQKTVMVLDCLGLTLNTLMGLILIPIYGIKGAAFSMGLSFSLIAMLRVFFAWYRVGVTPNPFNFPPPQEVSADFKFKIK